MTAPQSPPDDGWIDAFAQEVIWAYSQWRAGQITESEERKRMTAAKSKAKQQHAAHCAEAVRAGQAEVWQSFENYCIVKGIPFPSVFKSELSAAQQGGKDA